MSIDNEQLVFAEGNDGMASTETVAVATMSNNTKRIIVVDNSNQVCSMDDNDQLVPVTVGSYSGPLRRDDVDQSGNETITVADLQAAGINVSVSSVENATITLVTIDGDEVPQGSAQFLSEGQVPLDVNGSGLSSNNVVLASLTNDSNVQAETITDDYIRFTMPNGQDVYQLMVNDSVWATVIITA